MPIEIKELVVRAWVDSQNKENQSESRRVAKSGTEIPELTAALLEQLKRINTDKKDR